jgi:hypothetical protein
MRTRHVFRISTGCETILLWKRAIRKDRHFRRDGSDVRAIRLLRELENPGEQGFINMKPS